MKLPVRILTLILMTILSTFCLAESSKAATFVSGPTGTQYGPVFTARPKIVITDVGNGTTSSNDTVQCGYYVGYNSKTCIFWPLVGTHSYVIYQSSNGEVYFTLDGSGPKRIAGDFGNTVNAGTLYSGSISVDTSPPSVSISAPANNSNVSTSTVTVQGTASDTDTTIASVVVNGKAASLSGVNYSVSIPLVVGLNTVSVTATDLAGFTRVETVVINRLQSPQSQTPNTSGTNTSPQTASTAGESDSDVKEVAPKVAKPVLKSEVKDSGGVMSKFAIGAAILAALSAVILLILLVGKKFSITIAKKKP